MRTLSADMSVYSDIELEFFVKELTDALDCVERLSEPDEEYDSCAIAITRSPIFFGYTEAARKSIDRILNTIYTEQELRSTLKEEMMKKLDAYSLSQLTSIYYTVITDIEQHKDLLEMLSDEDGTSFRKDTENYIEKQERYLKLITDVIKKRNAETPTTDPVEETPTNNTPTNNDPEPSSNDPEPTTNEPEPSTTDPEPSTADPEPSGSDPDPDPNDDPNGDPDDDDTHEEDPVGLGMGNPLGSSFGMSYNDPDNDSEGN